MKFFSEMSSDYAEKSVNLNFMGGTFSIVYDAVKKVYNVFQDSFESEFLCWRKIQGTIRAQVLWIDFDAL